MIGRLCPNCDSLLVWRGNELVCPQCGHMEGSNN